MIGDNMKFIKSKLFLVLITAIIVGSVGVYAGTKINANDISYDSTHTVKDKIDDLYTKTNKEILSELTLKMRTQATSTSYGSTTNYMLHYTKMSQFYTHFKITDVSCNNYAAEYATKGLRITDSAYIELSKNVEYDFNTYNNIWTNLKSTTNGQTAYCDVSITFYNK